MRTTIKLLILLTSISYNLKVKAKEIINSRPNIIFVITDDQGMGDLSCMGNKVVKTPNIDQFYQKATRFTEYHVSPTCAPTRSAIMSGRYPFEVGVTHTIQQRERMSLDIHTLPQALKNAGYTSGLFGKWHLGDDEEYLPQSRGFDEVLMHGAGGIGQVQYGDFPPNKKNLYFDNVLLHNQTIVQTKGFCTDVFFNAALAWTKKQIKTEKPFFAYIALNAPHSPLVAPEEYKRRFLEMGYDKNTAGRYGMIENIDHNFGILISKLTEWKILENTLIVFTTDNGATHLKGTLKGNRVQHYNANLRGSKNSPYEGGNHVPFFCYWKGKLKEGYDIKELVAHVDIYPTFVELTGAKLPKKMQPINGRSLVPLLEGNEKEWGYRELFVHCGRWPKGQMEEHKYKKVAIRNQDWRYVNNNELFNVTEDPGETKNLIEQKPEIAEKLKNSFDKWWNSTIPLMINENLDIIRPENQPLNKRYYKQLKEKGIPMWSPDNY